MINYTPIQTLKIDDFLNMMRQNNEFSIFIPYTNRETQLFLSDILRAVFKLLKKPQLEDSLFYCLEELVMNGSRANSKRIYF